MTRMMQMTAAVVLGVLVVTPGRPAAQAMPEVALRAAMETETVKGDLKGAIEEYRKVVANAGANRALAAHALLRMAECYQKLGDAESRTIYGHIVREYADQKEAVVIARAYLGNTERSAQNHGLVLRKVWDGNAGSWAGDLSTVSQDGHRLSYGSSTTVNVHDVVTGADHPVAESFGGRSAMSRDGVRVAFEWYGGNTGRSELRIATVQEKGIAPFRRLYENADVREITPIDFSPDGQSVAVTLLRMDRTKQIGLIAIQDGSLRVLKSVDWRGPTQMFFSPDGRDLAFDLPANDSSRQRDVFILAVDGSREMPVVIHPSNDIVMGWSPDGQGIVFASDRRGGTMGVWVQALADRKPDGVPQLVKESIGDARSMGVTRSGALYLGTRAGDQDITVASIDLTAGKETQRPVRPIQSFIGTTLQPAWSPNGKALAYVSRRFSDNVLVIQSVETGDVRELRPNLVYWNQLSWAPDGRALVTGGTDLKGREGVFRIDAQTGETTLIVLMPEPDYNNTYPQWSPDEKHIYYRRILGPTATADVAFIERDLASGREREITRGNFGSINVSPDGRWIAAQRMDPSSRSTAVALISVSDGEARDLLHVKAPESIMRFTGMPWTPDGRAVLVRKRLTAETGELWIVPIDGTAPRTLDIDVNRWATGNFGFISLHPDGRRIAFLTGQQNLEVWAVENFLPALTAARR